MKAAMRAAKSRALVLRKAIASHLESGPNPAVAYHSALREAGKRGDLVRIDPATAAQAFEALVANEVAAAGGKLTVPEAAMAVAERVKAGQGLSLAWTSWVDAQVRRLEPEERRGAQIVLTRLLKLGRNAVDLFLDRLRMARTLPDGATVTSLRGLAGWSNKLESQSLEELQAAMRTAGKIDGAGAKLVSQELAGYLAIREVREIGVRKALAFALGQPAGDLSGSFVYLSKKPLQFAAQQVQTARTIATRRGTSVAEPGDWVIKGLEGEVWPVKKAAFERLYEPMPGRPGHYRARPRMLRALQLAQPRKVANAFGTHAGQKGDWLMVGERGPDGKPIQWVVEGSIIGKGWSLATQ